MKLRHFIDRNSDRLCVHRHLQTTVTSPRHGAESHAAKLRRAAFARQRAAEDALRERIQALILKDDPAGEPKPLVTNWGPAT